MQVYVAMCNYIITREQNRDNDIRITDHYLGVYSTLEKAIEACAEFIVGVAKEIGYEVEKYHCYVDGLYPVEGITEVVCGRRYDGKRRIDCSCEIYHESVD